MGVWETCEGRRQCVGGWEDTEGMMKREGKETKRDVRRIDAVDATTKRNKWRTEGGDEDDDVGTNPQAKGLRGENETKHVHVTREQEQKEEEKED